MIFQVFVFILGSIIGSFLNVCIYRLPIDTSILKPSSFCPHCKKPILWYDNMPLLSYLLLKGGCRFCKRRISFQYFIVELLTALMFLLFYLFLGGFTVLFFVFTLLGCGLLVASFIDLKYKIIPDVITIPGLVVGLIISLLYPALHHTNSWINSGISSLLGIIAGGVSIYLIGVFGKIVFKKDSMGAGDVKLLAMIGAFLGWKLTILVFFIAPVFGSLFGIIVKIKTKKDIIPYGPFLSMATLIAIFLGEEIIRRLYTY